MKMIRNIVICLGVMLLSVPLLYAQDLSKYRQFSLGASLAEVSKQIDQRAGDAAVIQQSPATIQQMEWWPVALNVLTKSEPVQKVIFSFYNGTLYKIVATYDNDATAGLTDPDMVRAISASYGAVTTKAAPETSPHANVSLWCCRKGRSMGRHEILRDALTRIIFERFSTGCARKQLNTQAEAVDCGSRGAGTNRCPAKRN